MNTEIMVPESPAGQPAVMLVTALAEATDLPDEEYRAIYARVAAGRSLRNIELALRSGVTFGWWAKFAHGERALDRERKNELRRWARANGGPDLPDLPPSVGEAVAAHVHPDAAVYQVGQGIASRVVLVGTDVPAISLRINGACQVASDALALESHQAACNKRYSRKPSKAVRISPATWLSLNNARRRAGQTWDEFLAYWAGLLEKTEDGLTVSNFDLCDPIDKP